MYMLPWWWYFSIFLTRKALINLILRILIVKAADFSNYSNWYGLSLRKFVLELSHTYLSALPRKPGENYYSFSIVLWFALRHHFASIHPKHFMVSNWFFDHLQHLLHQVPNKKIITKSMSILDPNSRIDSPDFLARARANLYYKLP